MPIKTANVIGSGPNGLAAAITLAQHGVRVTLYERNATLGGGVRSVHSTIPGFVHDFGAAVYPLGIASPFFRTLPLEQHGLRFIEPPTPLAHPLDDGTAVTLEHSLADTAAALGLHSENLHSENLHSENQDAARWKHLFSALVENWPALMQEILQPTIHIPKHPLLYTRFGLHAAAPATVVARSAFRSERTRALFAGLAAHSVLPLESLGSAATALVIGAAAHATGWPIIAGGAQSLTDALVAHFESLGGIIHEATPIGNLSQLEPADATLADISPRQLIEIAGGKLPRAYAKRLARFRYGPGAYKIDWALSSPIPWTAEACRRAATVHLGGSLAEIAAHEAACWKGHITDKPFVILVQPSLFDPARAPEGKHTAWAYCHVPNGSSEDMTARIEAQIERFAPGFRDCVLARSVLPPAALQSANPNLIGGDLSGGAMTLSQLLFRPSYRTPVKGLYLCSASTAPGGGVHGMCGHLAALEALKQ